MSILRELARQLSYAAVVSALLMAGSGIASAQTKGGTLNVAIQSDLRESENLNARITVDKAIMNSTVYDALFETDTSGNPSPSLATEWNVSDDKKEWTFTLRKGVKFHSGKDFTAKDVKQNLDAFLDPKKSNIAGDLENIESAEVVSDHQIKVRLKAPDGDLRATFTNNVLMADLEAQTAATPIGTGPYKWAERAPGDYIAFARFDDHWRGVPPLDAVEFRVIPEEDVAALELQSGGLDMILNYVSIQALPALRSNPDIKIHEVPGNTFAFAYTNFERDRTGTYKDGAAVREGLSYFWNAENRIPPIVGDFGNLANQVIPPWQLGHNPNIKQYPYDPEKGKELLAKGGINPGDELVFYAWSTVSYQCDIATSLASDLTTAGYKVKLECRDGAALLPLMQQYDSWDLLFPRTSGRANAATMYAERYALSLARPKPEDMWTLADDKIAELIQKMKASSGDEYVQVGQEIAQRLHDLNYQLPSYWENVRIATGPRVEGFVISPLGWYGLLMNSMGTVSLKQ